MSTAVADLDSPAVVAGKVARIQAQIDRWALVAILLGLAFTMVNVQTFAAAGAAMWTLPWLAAWLLDPMVSILLLVVVRAEQVTARWQVRMAWQVTATKWVAFAATYVMNTWSSIDEGVWSDIVLHSVPPVFVLIGAEVLPKLREGLTEAVLKARAYATTAAADSPERPLDLPPLTPPPDGPPTTGEQQGVEADSGGVTERPPLPPAGSVAGRHDLVGASDRAEARAAGGLGTDPAVRASITGATDRLLGHGGPPTTRPAPRELPDATPDVDDAAVAAGQSLAPTPPVEVEPPTTDTAARPGPGAAANRLPDNAGSAEPAGPQASPTPGATPPSSGPETGDEHEPRVLLLVEQLQTNPDLTGPDAVAALEVAGFGPVAARTARRLLSKARDALTPASRGAGNDTDTDTTNDLSPDPAAAPAAADDAADDAAGGAVDDDVPGARPPTPWAPTGTDAGRPLALVRPAAATPAGDR